MKLVAVFPDAESALAALQALGPVEHELYSAEPLHPPHVPSGLLKAAVLGGIFGGLGGMALATLTARSMNLYTGGMPLLAFPPIGIVTFALAGLGAIGSCLATLLWQADLLTLHSPLPDDVRKQIADGAVAFTLDAQEGQRHLLEKAGATTRVL